VFDLLLGRWNFVREVSRQASMVGRATIALVEEGTALYEETARVTLANGQTLNARQRYLYQRSAHPVNGFDILFESTQNLFQSLKFSHVGDGRLAASASHLCQADSYFSEYELVGEDRFYVQHTVRGPEKDYVVLTTYLRVV
jgi:hypothetical protein